MKSEAGCSVKLDTSWVINHIGELSNLLGQKISCELQQDICITFRGLLQGNFTLNKNY